MTNVPASDVSVSRNDITTRAQIWIDNRVPYSQEAYNEGYRTDCSGYVSMVWNLDTSHHTYTMSPITTTISKDELKTGDILLYSGVHVTIFDSWADEQKTKYWGYEQTSATGACRREIPYPYFTDTEHYEPKKYNHIH